MNQWCHPTISSSVVPFSSYPQSFLASGSFPMSWFFVSGGQSTGASATVLPMNIQGWFWFNKTYPVKKSRISKISLQASPCRMSTTGETVNPKGNQPWIFPGRTDAEAEAPTLWPPDVKKWLLGKDPDARKDWRCEEKGTGEDEMVGWYHWLNGHEFEQALGVGDGQGSLACCSPWGCKESDRT